MKHYLTFSAADFAQDEEFLRWVKYPEQYPLLRDRWLRFLRDYPHKKEEVEEEELGLDSPDDDVDYLEKSEDLLDDTDEYRNN